MLSINKPKIKLSKKRVNKLGLGIEDYGGGASTLCGGCGHDSITATIIQACFELSIPPHKVAKMSGIGCSSKTPGYFLSTAHAFNAVHGRMPSVCTGANAANRDLHYLAVSGDGDTGSIGIGQFIHCVRRQLNMLYIIENNGVYGLTKGQFSALADKHSLNKKKQENPWQALDTASLAIQLGASFVARGFSGDKKQLLPILKKAINHRGFALVDVLSPCVSFNNHPGSSKSYDYIREHEQSMPPLDDFVPTKKSIEIDYPEGQQFNFIDHSGQKISLSKKKHDEYNLKNKKRALNFIEECKEKGTIPTGLFYLNEEEQDFHDIQESDERPLRDIPFAELCPGSTILDDLNESLR